MKKKKRDSLVKHYDEEPELYAVVALTLPVLDALIQVTEHYIKTTGNASGYVANLWTDIHNIKTKLELRNAKQK